MLLRAGGVATISIRGNSMALSSPTEAKEAATDADVPAKDAGEVLLIY